MSVNGSRDGGGAVRRSGCIFHRGVGDELPRQYKQHPPRCWTRRRRQAAAGARETNPRRSAVWSLFGHPIRKLSHRVRSPVTLAAPSFAGPRHRRCSLDRERIIQEAVGLHGIAVGTGRPGRPRAGPGYCRRWTRRPFGPRAASSSGPATDCTSPVRLRY
jgi:hypothetical protein